MKEKTKDRLKSWVMTLGFAFSVGLCAFATSCDKVVVKSNAFSHNDESYVIVLIDDDFNHSFNNLYSYLYDLSQEDFSDFLTLFSNTYMEGNDVSYTSFDSDYFDEDSLYFGYYDLNNEDQRIGWLGLNFSQEEFNNEFCCFSSSDEFDSYTQLTLDYLEWHLNEDLYDGIYSAISADLSPADIGMVGVLQQFIQIITSGLVTFAGGVAQGIIAMATGLFLNNGSLSVFGGIVAIFAGLALAVGITTRVYTWITSLGN